MDIVSRTVSTLLVSSLVLLFGVGAAAAEPIDGLESRFGSPTESDTTASGAIDGLEVRYGSVQEVASATVTASAHVDGLEVRFAGMPASPAQPVTTAAGNTTVGVAVPVMVAIVAVAVLLSSLFGYAAGAQRLRRPSHA